MTIDADGAQAFYADVVGWSIADPRIVGTSDYSILTAPDGLGVGGLMTLPDGAPMKPGWFAHIGVQDVDATADRSLQSGGSVHMEPQDIPGVGRFAFVADPKGMSFYIMRGGEGRRRRHAPGPARGAGRRMDHPGNRSAGRRLRIDRRHVRTEPMSEITRFLCSARSEIADA